MAYSVLYHTPRSPLQSTCLVCIGVVGEQGSKQMIRKLTDPCGVEHGDCSSFPVFRELAVHFGHPRGLQNGVQVVYGSPQEEETSVH